MEVVCGLDGCLLCRGVAVAELSAREAHQIARRLFLIQVLLNYRTMQGGGYLFALWPWLRSLAHRAELSRDVSGYMNSHPVFAAFAAGAMRRKLELTSASPLYAEEEFGPWRESLAGPLGVTGDALIWDRWKPLVFAAATWVLLIVPDLTVWAVVACATLLVYNIPLYALRVRGVNKGYELGEHVLEALRDPRFNQWRRRVTLAGVVLAGALFSTGIWNASQGTTVRGAQYVIAFAVMLLGLRFRLSASTATLFAALAALLVPQVF